MTNFNITLETQDAKIGKRKKLVKGTAVLLIHE